MYRVHAIDCLHAIDYLSKFGYSREQAYIILGAVPIEGRLSGAVDIPNSCSRVYLPRPSSASTSAPQLPAPRQIDPGIGVPRAGNR